jgi:YVTN family beta-propeller protein
MKHTRAAALVAAVVATGAMAACGNDDSSNADPREDKTSIAPTPTPTESGPTPGLGAVVTTYPRFAGEMALVGHTVYVSNGLDSKGRLLRIDASTGRVLGTTATPPGAAHRMTLGNGRLWLTHPQEDPTSGPSPVTEVDAATGKVIKTFSQPNSYAAAVVGGSVWLLDERHNAVRQIDQESGRQLASVKTGDYPFDITYAFGSVWVANHHGNSVTRIDPKTGKVLATIEAGVGPGRVIRGGDALWVADWLGSTITRIDPTSNKVVATFVVFAPNALAFGDGALWVFDQESGELDRIDPATNKAVNVIPLTATPQGASALFVDGQLWLGVEGDRTYVIDPDK